MQGKLRLVRWLYERGYARQDILELFRFIDWVLTLPPGLERRFQVELTQLEVEQQMPYITSIERMGREQGLQQGLQQGEVLMLKRLLTRRFGPLPTWVEQRLAQASQQDLDDWADRVLEAQQLDEVFGVQGGAGTKRASRRKRP